MKRHLVLPIVIAGAALASGVASANPTYWRQNGLLLEVSADPRDGDDFVRVDPTRADRLELVALNDTVPLQGLTLQLSDGRTMTRQIGYIRPGQPVSVDMPESCGAIVGVRLDYIAPEYRRYDRSPARLQIIPQQLGDRSSMPTYSSYDTTPAPTYRDAYPRYYQPAASYRVQPRVQPRVRARAGWTIQGSFRF